MKYDSDIIGISTQAIPMGELGEKEPGDRVGGDNIDCGAKWASLADTTVDAESRRSYGANSKNVLVVGVQTPNSSDDTISESKSTQNKKQVGSVE